MATQLLSPVKPQTSAVSTNYDVERVKLMKSLQAPQQVQYLHLQAEIDVLLQELKTLKQQKVSADY